ncbi:MAG: BMC domain-containing protein [Planctomycetaceae bacterium]|nr:BMC domain-containing protein [Planctomycetales bacterium]MCB9872719.1 BMC domain-containing protein [Planctomycetaceae bacterium]MCB9926205.1 BMC domain-containing protein [Planctomycetaceae bacterium]
MQPALGILETTGFTPAIVALDVMDKAASVRVVQVELNDFLGVVIKVVGEVDSVQTAVAAGHAIADKMHGKPVSTTINRPDNEAWKAIESAVEFNPLIQQNVVTVPLSENGPVTKNDNKEPAMSETSSFALGFIETQGFTAVFEAIDNACKAANVEVLGKEKLGGGYVTVIIKGDVAAVKAAIDAGQSKVEGLGKLIAAHVIARPSESVMALLPKA